MSDVANQIGMAVQSGGVCDAWPVFLMVMSGLVGDPVHVAIQCMLRGTVYGVHVLIYA